MKKDEFLRLHGEQAWRRFVAQDQADKSSEAIIRVAHNFILMQLMMAGYPNTSGIREARRIYHSARIQP